MTFRSPTDIGRARQLTTPSSSTLLNNIETFLLKWQTAEHNGTRIITDKVQKQIDALKVHIRHGCLSNIECSGGTNLNEAFHRTINPHFKHAGRIGLPLAFALLSILFYNFNIKKMPKDETMPTINMHSSSSNSSTVSNSKIAQFGII